MDKNSDEFKVCTGCKEVLPFASFSKHRSKKDGLQTMCKRCVADYRAANKEKIAEYKAEYRAANKEKFAEYGAEYYAANKEKFAEYGAEYRAANKDKIAERMAEYRAANKDKIAEYGAEYRAANKDKIAERMVEYYAANKEKIAEYRAEYAKSKKYGITLDEYNKLLEAHKEVCGICYKECATNSRLSIDHCHKINKVRGLLCNSCNTLLGMYKDDIRILESAITYLKKHSYNV